MAIPEKPYTRKEMYLNAIAGGNGGIPSTPYTREEMYLDAIASGGGGGGGGSALPTVTTDDNGKVLSVVDGAWAADDNRFVVTLTPTNPDYSGTMDKTVTEINEAWNAGKFIYFDLLGYHVPCSQRSPDGAYYAYFYIYMNGTNVFAVANTADMDTDPNNRWFAVKAYQLTPMGG